MDEPAKEAKAVTGLEFTLAFVLFVISAGIGFYALSEGWKGQTWSAVRSCGFALIVLGGCFSPTNFLYLCLPWTSQPIRPHSRTYPLTIGFGAVGLLLVIIGWIGA
jgi:hypothetical protein